MNTTTIHIKTDVQTRNSAKKVAEGFGFSLNSLVNVVLRQIAKTKRLSFNLDETPNQYMIESLKKSEEAEKAGKMISFASGEEALAYVRSLINDKKKQKHSRR